MSELCLFNIKEKKLKFEELNELAKDVTRYSLENGYGSFFNTADYAYDFVEKVGIKTYFILSDSFLYKNADDLLDTTRFAYDSKSDYRKHFFETFSFFEDYLDIVFKYDVDSVEVWIDGNGTATEIEDYDRLLSEKRNFTKTLYDVFMKMSKETGYTFPSVVIEVKKQRSLQ